MILRYGLSIKDDGKGIARFQPAARLSETTGRYAIGDIFSSEALDLVSHIKDYGLTWSQLHFSVVTEQEDVVWNEPQEEVVGGVLRADDLVRLDSRNTFKLRLPTPCLGIVADDAAITVLDMPENDFLAAAGHDTIFGNSFLRIVSPSTKLAQSPVLLKDAVLPMWHRIFPPTVHCIENDHFIESTCQICGHALTKDFGIPIGVPFASDSIVVNEFGDGHSGMEPVYLLPREVCANLIARGVAPIILVPILNSSSPLSNRIRLITELLRL